MGGGVRISDQRVIIVTGAAQEIGRALAEGLMADEDRAKPKSQSYTVFVDEPLP